MFRRSLPTLTAAALLLAPPLPAAAQAASDTTQTTLRFHDTGYDSVDVQVRTGNDESDAVPFAEKVLKRGDDWEVDNNLPLFWRRELHPGSNDGQYTPWQRVYGATETKIDFS